MLVAGQDTHGNFNFIDAPTGVLAAENVKSVQKNMELTKKFLFAKSETK